ncbi:hypothetical protein GO615_27695, partial [Aromatoleum evansii]|nr:hypothetical protein [Aromatoleum evansii]
PRVVLQAVLALWTQAPATLAGTDAGEALRATAETLVRPAAEATTARSREPQTITADAAGNSVAPAPTPPQAGPPDTAAPATDTSQTPAAPHPEPAPARSILCADAPVPAADPPSSSRVSSTAASPAVLPSAADVDFHTRGGGFFFLLNVLNLPALRDWRATLAEPHAGWRELVRLARGLDFTPDAPLAAFLTDACALDPQDTRDDDPVAVLTTLP